MIPFIKCKVLEEQKKADQWLSGERGNKKERLQGGTRKLTGMMDMFVTLIVVVFLV